jgi:hypothetical protein
MDRYLFSRSDWLSTALDSPATLSAHVFFQLWKTRMDPYTRFSESDVVYIGDVASRRVLWEVRPASILRDFCYRSTKQALNALRSSYGLHTGDLNGYHLTKAGTGWLLAWAPIVMRKLDAPLPDGTRFGQNGYRRLSEAEYGALGLPSPRTRRSALMSPPPWYDPQAALGGSVRAVPRYIPIHVREKVYLRDGGRCVGCGASTDLHFDHIHPWSKGGAATVANLRLLCARSNLSKGAGEAEGVPLCTRAQLG